MVSHSAVTRRSCRHSRSLRGHCATNKIETFGDGGQVHVGLLSRLCGRGRGLFPVLGEVVEKFEKHYWPYKNALQAQVPTLKGKVLMCWCYPEQCHGDVIAEAANRFVACEEAVP